MRLLCVYSYVTGLTGLILSNNTVNATVTIIMNDTTVLANGDYCASQLLNFLRSNATGNATVRRPDLSLKQQQVGESVIMSPSPSREGLGRGWGLGRSRTGEGAAAAAQTHSAGHEHAHSWHTRCRLGAHTGSAARKGDRIRFLAPAQCHCH